MKTKNTRCPLLIQIFTEYMDEHPDQRFFQGITNVFGFPYLGVANKPDGEGFDDLWQYEQEVEND